MATKKKQPAKKGKASGKARAGTSERKSSPEKLEYDRQAVMLKVCERIATSNVGLAKILKDDSGLPSISTIMLWLSEDKAMAEQYARAREMQADYLADEIVEIADDGTGDFVQSENGPVFNSEHVQRSKLRVDARKWAASKLKPKKYGDRTTMDVDTRLSVVVRDLTGEKESSDDAAD